MRRLVVVPIVGLAMLLTPIAAGSASAAQSSSAISTMASSPETVVAAGEYLANARGCASGTVVFKADTSVTHWWLAKT